ncbi:membrane protein [Gordonia phage SpeedDemon]|nr:membrane protein [Gordonia phage SpeedDemon]
MSGLAAHAVITIGVVIGIAAFTFWWVMDRREQR